MVKIKFINNEKKICIDGMEYFISEELGYVNYREMIGAFLRGIEKKDSNGRKLENIYSYKNVPLYIFMRPAFSKWLTVFLENIYTLHKIKENYGEFKIITDREDIKNLNSNFFNMELEFIHTDVGTKRRKKVGLNTILDRANRCFKGVVNILRFKKGRGEKIVLYSKASTIAYSEKEGKFQDTLYGNLQEKLGKKFDVLNIQLVENENELKRSKLVNYNVFPLEILSVYKKVKFKKVIQGSDFRVDFGVLQGKKIEFLGYDISSEICGFIKRRGKSIAESYLREIIMFEELFKKWKVKKTVVIDEGDRARCLVSAGNLLGIETFAIQHGIIIRNSHSYHLDTENKLVVPRTTFLWGEYYGEFLKKNTGCYDDDNTQIVGNIRMERTQNLRGRILNDKKIKILYLSQYMDELVYGAGNILIEALGEMKREYELTIKLHPADNRYGDFYEEQMKRCGVNGRIVKENDLYQLMKENDCMISVHSTTILEGALFGKPSICIRLKRFDDICAFVENGISLGVKDKDELKNILSDFENSFDRDYFENMAKCINGFFHRGDQSPEDLIIERLGGN